jgi:hypothetical protein
MTYFRNMFIAAQDGASIDAFGRWRSSDPYTLFASHHQYSDDPEFWETVTTGSGSATLVQNTASVRMRTTTASGDSVIRQTYRYFRYMPGKSQFVLMTAVIGAAATNVRKRWGYFDADNGVFFQQTGAGLSIVQRSFTTGTPVDTVVNQADWNIDPMDGTGVSGVNLDLTKGNIFVYDFEWLGVGRVRVGVVVDGAIYYAHAFNNANNLTTVYMTTANLPVRYEIVNTGTAVSSTNDMHQICSTVVSEGGKESELQVRLRSAANGTATTSVTIRRAVLTIRPKATFEGLVNRAYIQPISIEFLNTGNQNMFVEIIRRGTLGGTPAWTSAGDTSTVEFDTAGTTVTGGDRLWSGYVAQAANVGKLVIPLENLTNADIPLTLDAAGASPVNLSVVATSLGNASACAAAITWKEVY